jgi:uncharacterized protein
MNRQIFARARVWAAAALIVGFTASAASAQSKTPPSQAAIDTARTIITTSGDFHAFDPIVPSILQQTYTTFLQQNPDLQKPLIETMQALQPEIMKKQAEVTDIMARTYASHFTEAELKEILAFYNTPTGKKLVAEQGKVMQESIAQAREWGTKMADQVQARVRDEMKKKGYTL